MPKYFVTHRETTVDRVTLETRWTEICNEERACWRLTLFNMAEGIRYCDWDAPNEHVLEKIFEDFGIKYSEITEVEVTEASEWCYRQTEKVMPYYLVEHEEPSLPRELVESRWAKLAAEPRALWKRTWHNLAIGKRYCWWEAPSKESLEQIFLEHGIAWNSIIEVELTTPADWVFRED